MKKRTEKQPVDDLFARRLKNMSLPPNPDGFARLQTRMRQSEPETRVVFWQNSAVHRYMAIAACLLLVCLFGWLYLKTETPQGNETTVAVNKSATLTEEKQRHGQPKSDVDVARAAPNSDHEVPNLINPETTDLSSVERRKLTIGHSTINKRRIATATTRVNKTSTQNVPVVTPTGEPVKMEVNPSPVELTTERQVTAVTDKPTPVAERVLVVTIAEPKALVAARQVPKQLTGEEGEVAPADKSEKDSKVANLWQQVKRVKQGEIFARKDGGEDERGLLGRAYSGLKQTFDKDKSLKQ